MASAPSRRKPRRVPAVSPKNTCGAPAPKTSLKKHSNRPIAKAVNSKIASRSMDICEGGTLAYTVSGPELTPGAVSDVDDFSLLAKQVVSGAVAAEMEGRLSSVPFVTLSLCAQVASTLKAKKTSKLLILNAHHAL
jgi:hypothetical protein